MASGSRTRRWAARVAAVLLLTVTWSWAAVPAHAATIAIDIPADGAELEQNADGAILIEGTSDSVGDDTDGRVASIMYVDGRFLTCDGTVAADPDDSADGICWIPLTPRDGGRFLGQINATDVEALGLDFVGPHTVEVVIWQMGFGDEDGRRLASDSVSFTIPPWDPAAAADGAGSPAEPGGAVPGPRAEEPEASASRLASGSPDAPSVLGALPTVQASGLTPARALLTAVLTLILLLIVGFPGQLLASTLSDNYDRVFGWTPRARARLGSLVGPVRFRAGALPSGVRIGLGVAAATVISGFVDPGFGFNPGSLRVLASVAIAFLVESVLGWWLIRRVLKKVEPELRPTLQFRAGSLVIVLIAVIVSRLVGFEPGMVFGLLVGLAFGASLATAKRAKIALVGLSYAFLLSVLAWLAYSWLTALLGPSPGFAGTFAKETLSGIAISGIASLPLGLLPLAVFDGGAIWSWKRPVWFLCYGIGLFGFLVILLPMPFSWGAVSLSFLTWVAMYIAYAFVAIGVWAWFRYRKPRVRVAQDPVH